MTWRSRSRQRCHRPGRDGSLRAWDGDRQSWVKVSLEHRDKERAKEQALEQSLKLRKGLSELRNGKATLGRVFYLYARHKSGRKTKGQRVADDQRIELWTRTLGSDKDPHDVTLAEGEQFIQKRGSGEIDARGNVVPEKKRRPVGSRTVEADCIWLRQLFGWAMVYRVGTLMRHNPLKIEP